VLSHCWSFEDEGFDENWYTGIELARVLANVAGI
jgi:hypothetical protein